MVGFELWWRMRWELKIIRIVIFLWLLMVFRVDLGLFFGFMMILSMLVWFR